jgi:hypothetical protein
LIEAGIELTRGLVTELLDMWRSSHLQDGQQTLETPFLKHCVCKNFLGHFLATSTGAAAACRARQLRHVLHTIFHGIVDVSFSDRVANTYVHGFPL